MDIKIQLLKNSYSSEQIDAIVFCHISKFYIFLIPKLEKKITFGLQNEAVGYFVIKIV